MSVLLAGCAGGGTPSRVESPEATAPPRGGASSTFERRVAPFPVSDSTGRPWAHPFFGGLNVPRPQFVDIDADEDLDLFIQEINNELVHFENVGTAAEAEYLWRTDRFGDLDVGEWNRFVDLDLDGDLDLLAEQPYSYVRYFRNDGSPASPVWTLAADSLKDAGGVPVFADRQNIPNLTDIDCDGVWDLFLGRVDGTVARYEDVGADERGLPRFSLVTERFEDIEIVAQFGGVHGANSMSFGDVDSDGDQDLFWGDFFEPSVLYVENTGTCEEPSMRGSPVSLPVTDTFSTSGYNATSLGDIDADGDLDLFVGVLGGAFNPNRTTVDNFVFLERTDSGLWTTRTRRYLGTVDVGSESVPALVDLDGDGDLDLLLANKIDPHDLQTSRVYVFRNIGSPTAPEFRQADVWDLSRTYHFVPTFGDLDGDGDPDMLVGTWNRGIDFYRNVGVGGEADFVLEQPRYLELTRGSNASPSLVDIDSDGDLDLFVGESSGDLNFYRNVGGPSDPRFELVSDDFQEIDAGRRSFPAFTDWDSDGDPDLLLGRESGGMLVYLNEGGPDLSFVLDESSELPLPRMSTPLPVDLDSDGDVDVLSGGLAGGIRFYENLGARRD